MTFAAALIAGKSCLCSMRLAGGVNLEVAKPVGFCEDCFKEAKFLSYDVKHEPIFWCSACESFLGEKKVEKKEKPKKERVKEVKQPKPVPLFG